MENNEYNVYKFINSSTKISLIVVSKTPEEATKQCKFDWDKLSVLHRNVLVVK